MKNPFHHIVPMLFTDYSLTLGLPSGLPSGLLFGLPMLLPLLFLPVGKGNERREEKRREEKRREEKRREEKRRDQTWLLGEMLKQGEARHNASYHYCSITQSDFTNSVFL